MTDTPASTDTPAMTDTLAVADWSAFDENQRFAWLAGLRPAEPTTEVAAILVAVRDGGDAALRELVARHDGAELSDLWVSAAEFAAAEAEVEQSLVDAIAAAAANIEQFHVAQRRLLERDAECRPRPGVQARRRFVPLHRVGGYVPGGRAALASSLLMIAVPARVAGVDEVVVATPPGRDGRIAAPILVAARVAGVKRILKAGGAQAIAALAYGTESVPRVDLIAGAGGAWVTAAKRAVSVEVAIDLPAGPSECVVLADADATPMWAALDMLGQAEHGPDSLSILVTDLSAQATAVERAIFEAAANLPTGQAALDTLRRLGRVVIVPDIEAGLKVAELIAPEHLSLQCAGAAELAERVRCAGAVFVGGGTPIAAGDYAIGTNHVLPTGGAARAWSGIGVETFGRWLSVQHTTRDGLAALAPIVAKLAEVEGMAAHAASVTARLGIAEEGSR